MAPFNHHIAEFGVVLRWLGPGEASSASARWARGGSSGDRGRPRCGGAGRGVTRPRSANPGSATPTTRVRARRCRTLGAHDWS